MNKAAYFLGGLLTGSCLWASAGANQGEGNSPPSPLGFDRVTPEVQVIRLAEPAVVSIQTNQLVEKGYFDRFGNWYRTHQGARPYSQGTGVLIDPEGLLITNEHVIRDADQIKVRFNPKYDRTEYEATLLNGDPESDLALLKITRPEPFPAVRLGRSDDLMTGERVIAIGNPYGEQNTVTAGILSAVGREVLLEGRKVTGLLQTDASINPGNSGGPLLNINGELIGINNAIHPLAEGIGFAIPANRVLEILNSRLLNPDQSKRLWLGARFEKADGPRIEAVDPGSPAERGGFRRGDWILEVAGKPVESLIAFEKHLLKANPGDRIEIDVQREGGKVSLSIVLGSYPDRVSATRLGVVLEPFESAGEERLRVKEVIPEGPGARIGIQRGDVLWALVVRYRNFLGLPREETVPVQNLDFLTNLLDQAEEKATLGIVVYRKGEKFKGEITLR